MAHAKADVEIVADVEIHSPSDSFSRRTFVLSAGALLAARTRCTAARVAPNLIEHPSFLSRFVAARDITIWLPPGYQAGGGFPVCYMHDGQNLFFASRAGIGVEWEVDEHMTAIAARGMRSAIVVGISNTAKRNAEYAPITLMRRLPSK